MALHPLERSIIKTLVYFDLLEYPLTATEIWKWLYRPELPETKRTLAAVARTLEESPALRKHVTRREGFYCLRGREHLIPMRKRRNLRVDRQMKKAVRVAKLLRIFPSIKMIAIASSLSVGNVKRDSDIDLFIISRRDQIWLSRFLAAGLLKLLRKRPEPATRRDRFCLTFFVTEDSLNVEHASYGPDDVVFQFYLRSFIPLYDPDRFFPPFTRANQWLEKHLPVAFGEEALVTEVGRPGWLRLWHRFFDFITWPAFHGPFQNWYCNMQLRILPVSLKAIANIDSRVILSDHMLKFHDQDNRQSLRKRWQESVKRYVA